MPKKGNAGFKITINVIPVSYTHLLPPDRLDSVLLLTHVKLLLPSFRDVYKRQDKNTVGIIAYQ